MVLRLLSASRVQGPAFDAQPAPSSGAEPSSSHSKLVFASASALLFVRARERRRGDREELSPQEPSASHRGKLARYRRSSCGPTIDHQRTAQIASPPPGVPRATRTVGYRGRADHLKESDRPNCWGGQRKLPTRAEPSACCS